MYRRAFLAAGGGLAVMGTIPAAAAVAEATADEVELARTYIASLRPDMGEDLIPRVGDGLTLSREPDRAYDPNSIVVHDGSGHKLGYLPADQSRLLAPLLDSGKFRLSGETLHSKATPRPEVQLRLVLRQV
jgi:hypothetical protein